ncbi:MAG: ABC transporter substrate-binding protein [Spirochaetales bacterium]|nr:MAG: ABC transporter substrate-binding protein [Spirochaetales bacterium]
MGIISKCVLLLLTLLFFSVPVFSSGVREDVSMTVIPIRVAGLKGPSGMGMAGMINSGTEIAAGYTVSFEILGTPDIMVSKLLSGEVDAAALPLNVAAKLYQKGAPYAMGAVTGYGSIYVVSSDPSIRTVADLKGKIVYNAGRGATPDYLFQYILTQNGLSSRDYVTVNFSYEHAELAQLLIAGKADTAVLPEPFVTMVLAKNPKLRIALDLQKEWSALQKSADTYPVTALVVKKSLAEEHAAFLKKLFAAYRESIGWVLQNPQDAGKISEEMGLGLPAAVAADAVPRLNLAFIPAPEARKSAEAFLSVFLSFDPKSIGGKLPDEGFYINLGD